MSVVTCDCKEWKESMKALNSCTSSAWSHGVQYTGEQFIYCPWCGSRLFDKNGVLKHDGK